ncbi:MAG TPA: hypothetical protein VLS90_03610 [Thermodesulfobacteriota bacterium]|nr:hypothetical protein [Thermodesulfobacteriota bacterium]
MKKCAFCSQEVDDGAMECPKCGHSRFIQERTKAPTFQKEELKLPERTLSDMHLAILEILQEDGGYVSAPQLLRALPLESESQAQLAVMAVQEMVDKGLLEVKGRDKVKITKLGQEAFGREQNLPPRM